MTACLWLTLCMTEMRCAECGETYVAIDPDGEDAIHWNHEDGSECGGAGEPVRYIRQ